MKVEVKEKEKEFQPIELAITIESEEELCSLWHRMNESATYINKNILHELKYEAKRDVVLFNKLDELVESRNLIEK